MIKNELGLNELIFSITDDIINSAILFLNTNESSLIKYIGALSLLPYNNCNQKYIEEFKKILQNRFLQNIYKELEELQPIFSNLTNISSDEISNILNEPLSGKLILNITYSNKIDISNGNNNYWGIIYLFKYLISLDLNNFEDWIKKTTRLDFKIIFLNIIYYHVYYSDLNISNLDNSKIGVLQAFYALNSYEIDNHYPSFISNFKDINGIFTSSLTNRSKFIIYLKYIISKYHGKKSDYFINNIEANNIIDKLLLIDYEFTNDEFFAYLPVYYSPIYLTILNKMQCTDKRQKLLRLLFNEVFKDLQNGFAKYNIDHAIILGDIAVLLNDFNLIEKPFKKEFKELSFPYSFCKIKNYSNRVGFMFNILLSIYTYCNKKKSIKEYLDDFNFIWQDKELWFEKDINPILADLNNY